MQERIIIFSESMCIIYLFNNLKWKALSEVIIPIDTFNPVEFFGVNDANLEVIRKNFPELKLVARGNEIK